MSDWYGFEVVIINGLMMFDEKILLHRTSFMASTFAHASMFPTVAMPLDEEEKGGE